MPAVVSDSTARTGRHAAQAMNLQWRPGSAWRRWGRPPSTPTPVGVFAWSRVRKRLTQIPSEFCISRPRARVYHVCTGGVCGTNPCKKTKQLTKTGQGDQLSLESLRLQKDAVKRELKLFDVHFTKFYGMCVCVISLFVHVYSVS